MGMMSSLFTAISGLKGGQTLLNVIGNNVANVNTTGYKAGRIQFRDLLSGSLSGGAGANAAAGRGGVNPVQVGTGLGIAAIDTQQRQGTFLATGNATDMAVDGDGFFVTRAGSTESYTRAGSFRFDSLGRLVDASGGLVQGWSASLPANDPLGRAVIDASNPARIGNITIRPSQTLPAHATSEIKLVGNLDAGSNYTVLANSAGQPGTTPWTSVDTLGGVHNYTIGQIDMPVTVYDSLGNPHALTVSFYNVSGTQINGYAPGVEFHANQWIFNVTTDPNDATVRVALDDMTYTDPASGALIRSAHAGELDFQTAAIYGFPDEGSTSDVNSAADLAAFGVTADPHVGYFTGMLNNVVFPPSDPVPGTSLFDNPGVPGFPLGFTMQKCHLVLLYQDVPAGTAATVVPPVGVSAGDLVNVNYTEMTTTAATPTQWYAQKININYGTLSTLLGVNMDPDDDGILGNIFGGEGKTEISKFDGRMDGLTQMYSGAYQSVNGVQVYVPRFTSRVGSQDGYPEGTLQGVSVDAAGIVTGRYDNGVAQDLAQVAIATFTNPGGLARSGDTRFAATANSGAARIGTALGDGRGAVIGGVLEQSNVELGEELTDMIVAQRSYEANARLVSLSDRLLDTVVNVGRA